MTRLAPLASFDPRMRELLLRGALERIEIAFDSATGARGAGAFELRLKALRSRLRADAHPAWTAASRCRIARSGNFVTLSPHDAQFDAALSGAGIVQVRLVRDPLADLVGDDPQPGALTRIDPERLP